jgi:4-amino-4-deoxy-L-arabinose transferase-like glycosyltransferase
MKTAQDESPERWNLTAIRGHRDGVCRGASSCLDLAIILGLALAVRLVWALIAPSVDPFLVHSPLLGDAASYGRIAKSLLAGAGFAERPPTPSAFWPPLYPAFLSLIYSVTGYDLAAARLVQAFLGVAVPASFFLISLKPLGHRVAWLSAVGLIFYPYLVVFNAWLIAESLFMALMSLGMLALSGTPDKPSLVRLAAAGAVFGLAALAKPFMLFVMPFLAVWLFLASPEGILRRIVAILVLAFAMLVVILPWSARNYRLYGQLVLISTNGGYTFLGANNADAWGGHDEGFPPPIPGLNGAEMEDAYYAEAYGWIRNNPLDFARLLIPKYRRLFSPLSVASFREDLRLPGSALVYVVYAAFLLAALYGAGKAWPTRKQIGYLYAPIAGVLVSAGLFYGDARYTLPMVPSLVVFAALSFESLWGQYTR